MTRRNVPYVDLGAQFAAERDELMPIIEQVLAAGQWIGGEAVAQFEQAMAEYVGVKHAVALNSGTDALILGMAALGIGPGDEVITPPNSFVASTAAVVRLGAKPVFVDVLADQNIDPERVKSALTPRTKAIMPVHLTGRVADMDAIGEIASAHGLLVVEDTAQSIGSRYAGRMSGSFGDIGCFSAHPLKNLNACGDGGVLTTNNDSVAETVRHMRNHGLVDRDTVAQFSTVSRMDTLQAAILNYRLGKLDGIIAKRRENAAMYRNLLDPAFVYAPPCRQIEYNSFHTFVVQVDGRDRLKEFLAERGIGTAIHYPVPIHLQPASRDLGYKAGDFPVTERQSGRILTLPINQQIGAEEIRYVADAVNEYFHSAT